jgi:hypothetical protein
MFAHSVLQILNHNKVSGLVIKKFAIFCQFGPWIPLNLQYLLSSLLPDSDMLNHFQLLFYWVWVLFIFFIIIYWRLKDKIFYLWDLKLNICRFELLFLDYFIIKLYDNDRNLSLRAQAICGALRVTPGLNTQYLIYPSGNL